MKSSKVERVEYDTRVNERIRDSVDRRWASEKGERMHGGKLRDLWQREEAKEGQYMIARRAIISADDKSVLVNFVHSHGTSKVTARFLGDVISTAALLMP